MAAGGGGSLPSFIGRRLLITIPLLLLISFAVFSLVLLIPGDPAVTLAGGSKANVAEIARIRHQLHLDQPFWKQYAGMAEPGGSRQPGPVDLPAPVGRVWGSGAALPRHTEHRGRRDGLLGPARSARRDPLRSPAGNPARTAPSRSAAVSASPSRTSGWRSCSSPCSRWTSTSCPRWVTRRSRSHPGSGPRISCCRGSPSGSVARPPSPVMSEGR